MLPELKALATAAWGFVFYIEPTEASPHDNWRAQDLARLESTPGIDSAHIGKMIGSGMQHRIYEYQEENMPMVLKVSTQVPFLRFPSLADAQQDLQFIAQYFPEYALEPTVAIPLQDGSYVLKQRRILHPHAIVPSDLNNPQVRAQFVDLLCCNQQMMAQVGRSLDFLGRAGQRQARAALVGFAQIPSIGNLVIEAEANAPPRIRIVDTDLENFHLGATDFRDQRSALAARFAVEINRELILHFFHIDLAAPR
jgi:hypothetical protein